MLENTVMKNKIEEMENKIEEMEKKMNAERRKTHVFWLLIVFNIVLTGIAVKQKESFKGESLAFLVGSALMSLMVVELNQAESNIAEYLRKAQAPQKKSAEAPILEMGTTPTCRARRRANRAEQSRYSAAYL